MWTKKIVTLLLTVVALIALLTACATTGPGDKNPFRHEPSTLPADHKPHRLGGEWPD